MRNTRSRFLTNHKRRRTLHSRMSVRVAMGTLLALLCATEARAAAVCSDTPGPNDRVYCWRAAGTDIDIDIDLTNRAIATSGTNQLGVYALQQGSGAISIGMTGGSIATTGASATGVYGYHLGPGGNVDIDIAGASISATGARSHSIAAWITNAASGSALTIDTMDVSVTTAGERSSSIFGYIVNAANEAALAIGMTRGSVNTSGLRSRGIYGVHAGTGRIAIAMTSGSISTTGGRAHGIEGYHTGAGGVDIDMRGGSVMTTGERADGVYGIHTGAGGIDIDVTGGSIATTGANSQGIIAWIPNAANEAAITIGMTRGSVDTSGLRGYGIYGSHSGAGGIAIAMRGGSIATTGASSRGITAWIPNAANKAAIDIDVTGGTVVGEGLFGYGAYGSHDGLGSATLTTGAQARIKAPFSIGAAGQLANAANAAGRLVITHGGAVEARNIGLQAWGARSSGHTFGAGAQTADDAARTEPMIAVASSGTVSVGASVTDAFIRDRIAGADETLSAAESAVLDAVAAGDSDALDTALAALPAAYDAAWKAEARNLLGKLAAEPSASVAAYRAADEILGLSRAGVRAAALSHHRIATFVRQGDRDPAILATAAEDRTPPQQAALAEQEKLSAAERTVLAAILTGGDLTAALAALPASAAYAYTDAWKDGVRQHAASYNAGGIRVDVTGGSISAEGNGVEAFYAVPHERNGAIAVAVAEGARVTGSRNGVHVRGAGAGEGDLRAQSVTVNGQVRGGTGAGVHMAGGGRLTVGKTGRVGATSGVGVLSDGAGDLHATVAGTVTGGIRALGDGDLSATVTGTVDGDIEGSGGGDHTVAVPDGGTVTGTVNLAGSTVTVGGTVGRITLATGGTVRVASTGQVTGVSAGSHGIRVGDDSTIENRGTIAGTTGIEAGDDSTIENHDTITGTTGIQTGDRSTIENRGTIIARTIGIQAGADSTIENHGTIAGTIGIEAGAGSTVDNFGTVRSTDGPDGVAINFQEAGENKNTLTRRPGDTIIGKIQGLGSGDTVDLSDVPVDELGLLTFLDANGSPVDANKMPTIREPRPGGVGRLIRAGHTLMGLDTTAFALTDDVLSDLTGSIHAAVLGTGLLAHAQDGVPAQGRVWATPFGGWREQTGNGGLADGTHTFGGGLVGAGWGTPTLSVGGFIGGSAGQLAVAGSRQNVDMQTVVGGVYAEQALRKDMRLDARVLVGHVAHNATRRVNPSTAHAAYTAFLFSPEIGAALRVPVTTTLHAVPRLRVRYAGLFTESFRERARVGNWDVGFAARAMQILEGRGEVSVPIALEAGGYVAPRLGVEGRWLMAGEMVEGTLPGGAFQVSAGGDPAVATGTLGLGLSLPVAAGTTLVGNFDGALTTEHAWRATGYIGITYSF